MLRKETKVRSRHQNAIPFKLQYSRNKGAIQKARRQKGKIISLKNLNHSQVLKQPFDTSSHYHCDSRKKSVNNSIYSGLRVVVSPDDHLKQHIHPIWMN